MLLLEKWCREVSRVFNERSLSAIMSVIIMDG